MKLFVKPPPAPLAFSLFPPLMSLWSTALKAASSRLTPAWRPGGVPTRRACERASSTSGLQCERTTPIQTPALGVPESPEQWLLGKHSTPSARALNAIPEARRDGKTKGSIWGLGSIWGPCFLGASAKCFVEDFKPSFKEVSKLSNPLKEV